MEMEVTPGGQIYLLSHSANRLLYSDGTAIPPTPLLKGDLDGSGDIDVRDVVISLKIVVNLHAPSLYQRSVGDMDSNEILDVQDSIRILQRIVGL